MEHTRILFQFRKL